MKANSCDRTDYPVLKYLLNEISVGPSFIGKYTTKEMEVNYK